MAHRLYVEAPLAPADGLALPPGPARHARVLRVQPGDALTLFDGTGGEWSATVQGMGRHDVVVAVHGHDPVERELALPVTLAVGMPANERMDALVEKAAELGAAAIQPLVTARSVLRLSGERALRRRDHWQSVAVAASEQSGRTRVARVEPVRTLAEWLSALPDGALRWLLAFDPAAPLAGQARPTGALVALSGPEGGLTAEEDRLARDARFTPVWLGPRILRADTAPLALLSFVALRWG